MLNMPSPPRLGSAGAPQESGFRLLFSGNEIENELFSQWRMVGQGTFHLANRSLVACPGDELGLLYYAVEPFDNFILRLDFLLPRPRGEENDNSGVHVRFRDPLKPVLPGTPLTESVDNPANVAVDTGYEIQIDEEARGDGRKNESDGHFYNRTGAIYKIKSLGDGVGQQAYANQQQLAANSWHSYEIHVVDRTYRVLLNGQQATAFTADPAAHGEAFRGRKKSEDENSGFIGLQAHTGNVAFTNVRIKVV